MAGLNGDDPYADGLLYDLEYADVTEDVEFYVEHARQVTGRVVELGCGTGRLTIPLARAGVAVHGVDASPAMIARLRDKLDREPRAVRDRIAIDTESWTSFRPEAPVDLVLWPFNALHHCEDDSTLQGVLRHIRSFTAPTGRLILDAYLPDRTLYSRDPDHRYEQRTFVDPATGGRLESWEQGWWDEAARIHHVLYVYRAGDAERRTHLRLRMFEIGELRAAVRASGWRILSEASNFRGAPLGTRALKWVTVAVPDAAGGAPAPVLKRP